MNDTARIFEVTTSTGRILKGHTYDERTFTLPGYDGAIQCKIKAADEFAAVELWESKFNSYTTGFRKYLAAGGRDWD